MTKLVLTLHINGEKECKKLVSDLAYSIKVAQNIFSDTFGEINLVVAKDKNQYDEILETSRPPWGVTTHKNGTIYMYDPFLWRRKLTGHNLSDLRPSLLHELVHLYMFSNQLESPTWFEEGLAVYISDENKGNKRRAYSKLMQKYEIPEIISPSPDFKKMQGKLPLMHYLTFYMFIKYLFENFGIKKCIKFVKSLNVQGNFEEQFLAVMAKPLSTSWLECKNSLKNMQAEHKSGNTQALKR